MDINISCKDDNLSEEIKNVCLCSKMPSSHGINFQNDMNNFLAERNICLNYIAYFHGDDSNVSIVTNSGILQFNGDQPNIEELESTDEEHLLKKLNCESNFKGTLLNQYIKYEDFIVNLINEDTDLDQLNFEESISSFIEGLFFELAEQNDVGINCYNNF